MKKILDDVDLDKLINYRAMHTHFGYSDKDAVGKLILLFPGRGFTIENFGMVMDLILYAKIVQLFLCKCFAHIHQYKGFYAKNIYIGTT